MKTLKVNHLDLETFETTVNKLESSDILFYVWPNSLCVVFQCQPWQMVEVTSHMVQFYQANVEQQQVTSDDLEQLELKSYARFS